MKKTVVLFYVIAGIFLILGVSLYVFIQKSATDYNFEIFSSEIGSDEITETNVPADVAYIVSILDISINSFSINRVRAE